VNKFSSSLTNRSTILQIVGTLVAIGLLLYLLSQQGWEEIQDALQKMSLWRLGLALGIMFVSRFSVTARWHTLLRSADINIHFRQTARITFAGLFLTNFLPTTIGGDVIRLVGAAQMKFDAAVCTASLIVDRLVGLFGMLMAVPFGLPSLLNNPNAQFSSSDQPIYFSVLVSEKWFRKIRTKILGLLQRILEAIDFWINKPLALGKSLTWSWLHMICLFTIIHLLLAGMGESLPLWKIAGFYSLVYLVTLIPISINGYGVQELTMTFVMTNFGGISIGSSISLALLFRTLMMLASLPGVLFVPGLLSKGLNTEKEAPDLTDNVKGEIQ
jgi:uncharacterized membrane protein YbhN (UPF0104 family)